MLLLFVAVGIALGYARRGRLGNLAALSLRGVWLLFFSVILKAGATLAARWVPDAITRYIPVLAVVQYAALLLFFVGNMRERLCLLAGAGVLLNMAVILANGGQMPVGGRALSIPAAASALRQIEQGLRPGYTLAGSHTHLVWLGDVLYVPGLGMGSVGDAVMGIGVMLLLAQAMQPPAQPGQAPPLQVAEPPADPQQTGAPLPPPWERPRIERVQAALLAQHAPPDDAPDLRLGARLATLALLLHGCDSVVDVGCDHGKLAVYLARSGMRHICASDISLPSLNKARALAAKYGLQQYVQTLHTDGLRGVPRSDAIVIAGLGGPTICEILAAHPQVAAQATRIVLQPMNAPALVRQFLAQNGYTLLEEAIAYEQGRFYQLIAACPGQAPLPPPTLCEGEFGSLNIARPHPLLLPCLLERLHALDGILAQLAAHPTDKACARHRELTRLRAQCMEVLTCLLA